MSPRSSHFWRSSWIVLIGCAVASTPVHAADRLDQRAQFRTALAAASRQGNDAWKRIAFELEESHYPLAPYIELAALRARIATLRPEEVKQFLRRWPDSLPASELREAFLRELARRHDWTTFRTLWKGSDATDLQCDNLQARLASGAKLDYGNDLVALWEGPHALPNACDPAVRAARQSGALTDALVWQRLDHAAAQGHAGIAAAAATLLGGSDRDDANRIVAVLRDPASTLAKANTWPDTSRHRDAVAYGIARYARRNSAAAETVWAGLQSRFQWSLPQKDRVLRALALYRATSYSPDAIARLDALPASAEDDATREWHVRVNLANGDYKATLAALDALSPAQKDDPRWHYLRARMLSKLDRDREATPIFAEVARGANFYGFLAADWIKEPYSICPDTLADGSKAETQLASQIDLERAFEFRALTMLPAARREWNFAMRKLDKDQRRLAADLAYRRGWYDRAVFAYSADPATQHLYEQRFPLGLENQVKRNAREAGIDPAWAYAIIRAESAWMTDARSGANAYGLMQLLPGVGKQLAKAEGLPYHDASDLFDPGLNLALGTRFLGQMADAYDGSPWLASAAYNAGKAPVGRWLDARRSLDPDFFIETIPYKETREYVARVLAFSVIYDWRMHGNALALSARMPKIGQPYRAPTAATPRKSVVCAAAESEPATVAQ